MKAIRLHAFGGPENLTLEEVDTPIPARGEVLIRNRAAGVNPIDWKTCSGGGASAFIGELPYIPGWECAGTIEALGDGVSEFSVGDEVFGFLRFPEAAGCYAEYVCAPINQIAKRPQALSVEAAGSLGLAGLTAWQALHDKAGIQAGQRVLVLAAAGGVGHLAVQLAKAAGAHVIGTASSANQDFIASLGCDECIDYTSANLSVSLRDIDIIIDGVGGATAIEALPCLKSGGVMVTLPSVTAAEVAQAGEKSGYQVMGIRVEPNGADLAKLAALAETGQLTLSLAQALPLAEAGEAHRLSASGHQRGKLVLTLA
ncbi:Bifunctional protein: zinc-containing alcohol dehydrogenase [Marinobacterium lacunae]|uniref:Bifunctional protein: zinc-containing alcohol dehydrogenase n=1 Tax=Marinobacterium lacunae TaxID=1232683 RepID=A0A081FV72_9GAMM|nr:NADP-dependent oxidoreductase [Marinobacterium lacunae]KEA62427.1 Bifunctional protein: zinc-containing alcohol dehydrogenase [Marinobacterium lacunae]